MKSLKLLSAVILASTALVGTTSVFAAADDAALAGLPKAGSNRQLVAGEPAAAAGGAAVGGAGLDQPAAPVDVKPAEANLETRYKGLKRAMTPTTHELEAEAFVAEATKRREAHAAFLRDAADAPKAPFDLTKVDLNKLLDGTEFAGAKLAIVDGRAVAVKADGNALGNDSIAIKTSDGSKLAGVQAKRVNVAAATALAKLQKAHEATQTSIDAENALRAKMREEANQGYDLPKTDDDARALHGKITADKNAKVILEGAKAKTEVMFTAAAIKGGLPADALFSADVITALTKLTDKDATAIASLFNGRGGVPEAVHDKVKSDLATALTKATEAQDMYEAVAGERDAYLAGIAAFTKQDSASITQDNFLELLEAKLAAAAPVAASPVASRTVSRASSIASTRTGASVDGGGLTAAPAPAGAPASPAATEEATAAGDAGTSSVSDDAGKPGMLAPASVIGASGATSGAASTSVAGGAASSSATAKRLKHGVIKGFDGFYYNEEDSSQVPESEAFEN